MTTDSTVPRAPAVGRYRYLVLAGAALTYLLVAMGGVVCITGSGGGCPDWPRCFGRLIPPWRLDAIIEYLHRFVALLTMPLILASAIGAWRHYRSVRWLRRATLLAVVCALAVVVFGAFAVLTGLPRGVAALDLGAALATLALMVTGAVLALARHANPALPERPTLRTPFARFSLWTMGAVYLVLVSAVLVADRGSIARCVGWPLYTAGLSDDAVLRGLQVARRVLGGLTTALVLTLAVQAWRTQRSQRAILPVATLEAVLLLAETLIGAVMIERGLPPALTILYVATGAAIWAGAVALAVLAGFAASQPAAASLGVRQPAPRPARRAGDLLALTRPIVVALLLVAAYTGMVAGGRALPPLRLAFWTLLGQALATGGAQALNQYFERDLDRLMARTTQRPLPAGRLTPAEGLAWGLALCLAALYLLAVLVNGLVALLTLLGIVWYVVIYTLLLKRTSVQNVVIGGAAGGLLPLIGWAAATGRLEAAAWMLFGVVFLWSPPHFWSLALVHVSDYARAGLPMLPIIRGESFTRGRILGYAVALVLVTLALPLFRLVGGLYLVVALALGGALLYGAWRVWREGSRGAAWGLYRLSSLYLGLLFLALVADTLI